MTSFVKADRGWFVQTSLADETGMAWLPVLAWGQHTDALLYEPLVVDEWTVGWLEPTDVAAYAFDLSTWPAGPPSPGTVAASSRRSQQQSQP